MIAKTWYHSILQKDECRLEDLRFVFRFGEFRGSEAWQHCVWQRPAITRIEALEFSIARSAKRRRVVWNFSGCIVANICLAKRSWSIFCGNVSRKFVYVFYYGHLFWSEPIQAENSARLKKFGPCKKNPEAILAETGEFMTQRFLAQSLIRTTLCSQRREPWLKRSNHENQSANKVIKFVEHVGFVFCRNSVVLPG